MGKGGNPLIEVTKNIETWKADSYLMNNLKKIFQKIREKEKIFETSLNNIFINSRIYILISSASPEIRTWWKFSFVSQIEREQLDIFKSKRIREDSLAVQKINSYELRVVNRIKNILVDSSFKRYANKMKGQERQHRKGIIGLILVTAVLTELTLKLIGQNLSRPVLLLPHAIIFIIGIILMISTLSVSDVLKESWIFKKLGERK